MKIRHELAIVIPAFKACFLHEALSSIAAQTNKRFTLYIGDDASPEDLYNIVQGFETEMEIIYHRFEQNLGSIDLAGHWNRCIDLVQDETWVWLFSDDDTMSSECVACFYQYIEKNPDEQLLHFNVDVINAQGQIIRHCPAFPPGLSAPQFFVRKIKSKLESFAVEYIFRKSAYERCGKFQPFDLAWGSDDATWMKMAQVKDIKTITGAKVQWRQSGQNITCITQDEQVIRRKFNAAILFLKWSELFFSTHQIKEPASVFAKSKFLLYDLIYTSSLSFRIRRILIVQSLQQLQYEKAIFPSLLNLAYGELKKKICNQRPYYPNPHLAETLP